MPPENAGIAANVAKVVRTRAGPQTAEGNDQLRRQRTQSRWRIYGQIIPSL